MSTILISSEEEDFSTSAVIDWLLFYEGSFVRVNEEDDLGFKIELSNRRKNISISSSKGNITFDQILTYWYRRGNFNSSLNLFNEQGLISSACNKFYINELNDIQKFIHLQLLEKHHINSFIDNDINKLYVLSKASQFGLKIPITLVTNSKAELNKFVNENQEIITKPIKYPIFVDHNDHALSHLTTLLTKDDIVQFPEKFNYTLFQECVKKKYELRIFYLAGKFFSSAILSQRDEKTRIDFRNYNYQKPNRVLPYKLSKDVKGKLKGLFKELKINSGSIDIIVNLKNEFIFLEINPIGQFDQVSRPCNYFLEKEIALYLINNGKQKRKPFKKRGRKTTAILE